MPGQNWEACPFTSFGANCRDIRRCLRPENCQSVRSNTGIFVNSESGGESEHTNDFRGKFEPLPEVFSLR